MPVRKVKRFSGAGLGYTLQVSIIGRMAKYFAEKLLHSQKPPMDLFFTN